MEKQEQFLWGVQTLLLLDAQNFSLDTDHALKNRHHISATGKFGEVMGAIEASKYIPDDLSAQDAIHEFFWWRCARYDDENARPLRPTWLPLTDW